MQIAIRKNVRHETTFVNVEDLIDARSVCPVCTSRQARRPVIELQSDPRIDLLECPTCRACSASMMPSEPFLERCYADYYVDDSDKVTFDEPHRFGVHICRSLDPGTLGKPVRILDFGGGDGSLSLAISRRLVHHFAVESVEVTVVDFVSTGVSPGGGVSIVWQRSLEDAEGTYDIVVAGGILEHIPFVQPVMRDLFQKVAPGGYFYARTPWNVPFARMVSVNLTYPIHVHDMGALFWGRVPEAFNLDVPRGISRPAIVETTLSAYPLRTVLATLLKLPGRIESRLSPIGRRDRWWRFVGGWEVLWQIGAKP